MTEWIDRHANEEFAGFVNWLRGELDRAGRDLSPRRQRHLARHFRRTMALERAFFDAAYASTWNRGTPEESSEP